MPYVPDTPPTGQIKQPDADQSLSKFHILDVQLILKPGLPAETKVRLKWSEGYMDGETYVPVNTKSGAWDGAVDEDLVAAITKVTVGGTIYGEVKTAMWEFLQTKGVIPAGVIT